MRFTATLFALVFSASSAFAQVAFDPYHFGRVTVTNTTGQAATFTLIIWDANDYANQTDVGRSRATVAADGTAEFTVGVHPFDACTRYQRDVYINLPASERYTLSDVGNYFYASGGFSQVDPSQCAPTPPTSPSQVTPPPPQDGEPPCVAPGTFNIGGSPSIARFPDGYTNPWFPAERGPFYWAVPVGVWRVTAVTGDNHVGVDGKYDGTQAHEVGTFVLSSGQTLGPTLDVPDDQNYVVTDFGIKPLISGFLWFKFVHAGPTNPAEPTDSFFPVSLTLSCP